MRNLLLIYTILILISCEEMPKKEISIDDSRTQIEVKEVQEKETESEIVIEKNIPEQKIYSCTFGEVKVTVKQKDDHLVVLSNLSTVEPFKHNINGEISSFIETDVNTDGFNEFYCITNQGELIAYSSYRNKSFGEIYVPKMPNSFYKNLKEVKSWEVKNNKLHLVFSNTVNDTLNTVRYKLMKGETGFILTAH